MTVLVIGPALSWLPIPGIMPLLLTSPQVGFRPTRELWAAGLMMEPEVSVPMATVTRLAATAAALPELEPPMNSSPGRRGSVQARRVSCIRPTSRAT